jgi:O-antigen ligase
MHDSQKSGYNRVDMWAEGLEMEQQNPIFGIGKGKFHEYTSKLIAHNSAIEIMGETGLPGFFFWVALAYMNLKNLTQYISIANDVRNKLFTTALFISVIGYIISSMFVTLEYETYYMLLALCSSVGRCSPNRAETTKVDIRNIIILCGLLSLL